MARRSNGFTLIELLIVVAIIGIIAAIAIPNLLNAIDRGRQKRSMADLRTVATVVEQYEIDNSFYPLEAAEADLTSATLRTVLQPVYIRRLPIEDGWNFSLRYQSSSLTYTVGSLGKDGGAGGSLTVNGAGGGMNDFDCDIIFVDGSFVQWPEGVQAD